MLYTPEPRISMPSILLHLRMGGGMTRAGWLIALVDYPAGCGWFQAWARGRCPGYCQVFPIEANSAGVSCRRRPASSR